jgi:hypothetical protein
MAKVCISTNPFLFPPNLREDARDLQGPVRAEADTEPEQRGRRRVVVSNYVDDVGGIFTAYNAHEDGRECIGGDLAEIGAAEAARQFAEAEAFFRGFLSAAEHVNYAVYILAGEALDRAKHASA